MAEGRAAACNSRRHEGCRHGEAPAAAMSRTGRTRRGRWSNRRITELLGSGSWWCQAAGVEESEGEGWPVLHPLEPVLGDAVQVVDAARGEIGHAAFEAGPHILDRVEFGRVAGQPVDA